MSRMNPLEGVLGETFTLYKRYASHFLPIAFLIYAIPAVVAGVLQYDAGQAGRLAAVIITAAAGFLLQAAVTKAVADVRDGRVDLTIPQTMSAAAPFIGRVAGASILAGIAIGIGLVLVIVPGLILLTFWALIVPWIVLGGASMTGSFSRSWQTVRGHGWQVFGKLVVAWIVLVVFSIILGLALIALPGAARGVISNLVSGTLVSPFIATLATLIYYRLTSGPPQQPADPPFPQYGPWSTPPGGDPGQAGPYGGGGYGQAGPQ
jgi:hypothetical protein